MSTHKESIKAFKSVAASSQNQIVKAYCGMVSIELVLKSTTGLKNHDVPAALRKFSHIYATGLKSGCKIKIDSLATQLSIALQNITVQGTDGKAKSTPMDSYPNIRYIRHSLDGWPAPVTAVDNIKNLSLLVEETRKYLFDKFQQDC
ncbi:hypothetical protein HA451_11675 [Aeromonas veronii]|uniref:hypothetical protein n=1 Tax=Aeromonas veronii TaxID=654 RepID=UPI00142F5B0A|nr:hypothetical protein [Aeromonas veronii]NJI23704.1 hypothetical protein [Aeromonas veronii]NJI34346.1 hypothetical protein [Aeromonas veronii]